MKILSLEPDTLLRTASKFRRSIPGLYKPLPVEKETLRKSFRQAATLPLPKQPGLPFYFFVQKELAALKQQVSGIFIDDYAASHSDNASADMLPYLSFNQQKKPAAKTIICSPMLM